MENPSSSLMPFETAAWPYWDAPEDINFEEAFLEPSVV